MPGETDRIMENPVSSGEDRRLSPDFYKACMMLRQQVRKVWGEIA
jgi:hypothetical protein